MSGTTIKINGLPHAVSEEEVTRFLEEITGEATIVGLNVRPMNNNPRSRAYAFVQFTYATLAEDVSSKAQQRLLQYEGRYLQVQQARRDILQMPRPPKFKLEHLHVGSQVSDDRFFVLWSVEDVEVNFGFEFRKLQFFLRCHDFEYKLELFYGNIRQIELHHHHDQDNKYITIQMTSAPRIYKNNVENIQGYQWVRETDFTPHCCIGQSPSLCLEVPYNCELPDIREHFVYFKESQAHFTLVEDSSFCQSSDLVPIVEPPQEIQLPYNVLFKANSLVQKGIIMRPTLDDEFYSLLNPSSVNKHYIDHALEALSHLKEICFEPVRWLRAQYSTYKMSGIHRKSSVVPLEPGLVYVHRVQVTPTKVYFRGPEVNESNRVLRHFAADIEDFIRVSFVNEDCENIRSTDLILRTATADDERHTNNIYKRILSTLRNGIVIGKKKFEFLAYSSSQLRENSVWMFASRSGLTAANIRDWMGDFRDIKIVAKYAARLGQSFGSSKETFTVAENEIECLSDIKTEDGKYNFSDGIGKISADFAEAVATKCNLGSTPSAFQIRIGGYKGVVAVDPHSKFKLSLRDSMCKFKSENTKLDVLSWSKYQPCFLNRQLITLLSTLGVPYHAFRMKQREAVSQLDMILTDPVTAQEVLEVMSPGYNSRVLVRMLQCGFKPQKEPFLSMMLQTFRASKLWELRTKSRIFVPDARLVMGCLDETGTLEYGQVFVNISRAGDNQLLNSVVVVGEVFVGRNPCLHPGDVRVLTAVNVPALQHLVDCVVFPQKGKRPHPSECSGGDLDGDRYFVCWDSTLIPRRQVSPMQYTPASPTIRDRHVEIEEVEEFFANYMVNDCLGLIADAHLAIADGEPHMAESDSCKKLAMLHSTAVDFPKSGVPAYFPNHLRAKKFPDFMEKPNKCSYKSNRPLGKLFRDIKDIAQPTGHITAFTREVAVNSYDPDMEVEGFEDYIEDAFCHKDQYDFKLGNLMLHYGIETESEIVSGNIMKLSSSFTIKKDADTIALAIKSLKREARAWFDEKASGTVPNMDDNVYAKASAWYHVTYHPDNWGRYNEGMNHPHFISFAWCVYEKLTDIKEKKVRMRGEEMASLELSLGQSLSL